MNWRLRLPGGLYRLAVDKAGDEKALAELVIKFLTRWTNEETAQQLGGKARAAALSESERSAIAKSGADARWKDHHLKK